MKKLFCISLLPLLISGCPTQPQSAVTARIDVSVSQGDAPLSVSVTGAQSSSRNGGTLTYAWDFAGEATADTVTANHTFTNPGLYRITLLVTDEANEEGTTGIDVRARGVDPTAVIQADLTSGSAPLVVQFDGTDSTTPDDVIRDYLWDFGDQSTSGKSQPIHAFQTAGTYTVTLTVITAGGAQAEATTTITVTSSADASLQFDGSQRATFSLGSARTLSDWTFEAWYNATTDGGTLVSAAGQTLQIEILPATNQISFQIGGVSQQLTVGSLSGSWKHIALTHDAAGEAVLYLNAQEISRVALGGDIVISELNLGLGFEGKVSDVRLWQTTRTATEIDANYDRRLPVGQSNLLGYWQLDEAAGQWLINQGTSALPGVRGSSSATEATDPAWSTDGPGL